MKSLIAYSSVAHMGVVFVALMCINNCSLMGGFFIMLGHGFCSSGLFYGLNTFYERTHSRSVLLLYGVSFGVLVYPFWWFLLCIGNISSPFSLNFLSELMMILGFLGELRGVIFFLIVMIFVRGLYRIYLFIIVAQGRVALRILWPLRVLEHLIFYLHAAPLFLSFFVV